MTTLATETDTKTINKVSQDMEPSQISQESTALDGTLNTQEQISQPLYGQNDKLEQDKRKDKKKKKRNIKDKINFQRKLSVDPTDAQIKFTNLNEKGFKAQKDKKRRKDRNREDSRGRKQKVEGDSDTDHEANEDLPDYMETGYHPVHIGEILDSKYIIVKKLGWGHFSTVWLGFNIQDKKLYALKVMRSHKKYTETGFAEEGLCKVISENYNNPQWQKSVKNYMKNHQLSVTRDHTHCIQMFDWFFHSGINGKHFVMAFEVLGKNLLFLIKKYEYRGIPIPIVRELTKQLLMGLDYMHRICKLIHTDLKPENINFANKEEDQFDMLFTNVLTTPLIDIFEQKDKIILSKTQLKNQKKKDRKKKKKLSGKAEAEETKEEEPSEKEEQLSRARFLIDEMRKKLDDQDKQFYVQRKRRNQSEDNFAFKQEEKLLKPHEVESLQDHPLRNPKQTKPKKYMRMNSQDFLFSDIMRHNQTKPMDEIDVRAIKESNFNIKIVDMGNACYFENKFSEVIQTRQYRSPEVIIRRGYDESADLWSLACTIFELATGDLLFLPKKGKNYTKNQDHLALISELIGECNNTDFLLSGRKSDKYFEKNGKLKNIKNLKPWGLYDLLMEKYRMREFEAKALSDFLLKILKWEPKDRPTASELLNHYWLKMIPNYNTKMTKKELREYRKVHNQPVGKSEDSGDLDNLSQGKISDNVKPTKAPKKANKRDDDEEKQGQEEEKKKKEKKKAK